MAKATVVVIGGGAAGATTARLLSKKLDRSKHDLVLINPRAFDMWLPALVRVAVTSGSGMDELDKGAFSSYDRMFQGGVGSLKVGTVVGIEAGSGEGGVVRLASGEAVPYTVLVLASGSIWEGPLDLPNTKKEIDSHLQEWRQSFSQARHIVLAGGGAVGVEIAGELKDAYPNKNVTIVQGPDAIMNPTYNAKFRKTVAKGLTSRGVNIIYNDYIDNINSDGSAAGVVTRNNRRIDADLVVPTRGGRPNTAFLASSGFNLNSVGQVQVEKSFQVKGRRGVFAVGDITDIKEQKQAAKYGGHAAIVVPNVLAALEKREATKQYAGQPEVMIVSNGKNGGTGYMSMMGGITLGNWFAKMVKSKDLFVGMHRKEMGFTA